MQDDRTIAVNVDDLERLAYWASMGILEESEGEDIDELTADEERDYRADLGRTLAMAYAHGNMAADAQNQDGTRVPRTELGQLIFGGGPDDLPYREIDILEALSGKLTSRRLPA